MGAIGTPLSMDTLPRRQNILPTLENWTMAVQGLDSRIDVHRLGNIEVINLARFLLGPLAFRVLEAELIRVQGWQQFLNLVQERFGLDRSTQVMQFHALE